MWQNDQNHLNFIPNQNSASLDAIYGTFPLQVQEVSVGSALACSIPQTNILIDTTVDQLNTFFPVRGGEKEEEVEKEVCKLQVWEGSFPFRGPAV